MGNLEHSAFEIKNKARQLVWDSVHHCSERAGTQAGRGETQLQALPDDMIIYVETQNHPEILELIRIWEVDWIRPPIYRGQLFFLNRANKQST